MADNQDQQYYDEQQYYGQKATAPSVSPAFDL